MNEQLRPVLLVLVGVGVLGFGYFTVVKQKPRQRFQDFTIQLHDNNVEGFQIVRYLQSARKSEKYANMSIEDKIAELRQLAQNEKHHKAAMLQAQQKIQKCADIFYALKKMMNISAEIDLYIIGGTGVLSGETATQENILYDPWDRRIYISGCYFNYEQAVQRYKLIQELQKVQKHQHLGLRNFLDTYMMKK